LLRLEGTDLFSLGQRAERLVGDIELDAEMRFQRLKIRPAFRDFLLVFPVRRQVPECTVEQRDATVRAGERRHTGKSKERAGVGRSKVVPVGNVTGKDVAQIKTVEVLPVPVLQSLQHDAIRPGLDKLKRLSILCGRMIEFERNRGTQPRTAEADVGNPFLPLEGHEYELVPSSCWWVDQMHPGQEGAGVEARGV